MIWITEAHFGAIAGMGGSPARTVQLPAPGYCIRAPATSGRKAGRAILVPLTLKCEHQTREPVRVPLPGILAHLREAPDHLWFPVAAQGCLFGGIRGTRRPRGHFVQLRSRKQEGAYAIDIA